MLLRRIPNYPAWRIRHPFDEMNRMQRQMELLLDEFQGASRDQIAGVFPLMNFTEDKDNYYLRAELPGINVDKLDISVTGNTLSIAGERTIPELADNATYHRRERDAGQFSRIVSLPSPIDAENVDARCVDGILTITLAKPEVTKPKQITIKTS